MTRHASSNVAEAVGRPGRPSRWSVLSALAVAALVLQLAGPAMASHDDMIDPDNVDHYIDRHSLTTDASDATIHAISQLNCTKMNATLNGSGDEIGPKTWRGKEQFCTQAELLGVGEPQLERTEQVDVLQKLAHYAPQELRGDLSAISEDPRKVDERATDRIGQFIERRCDVNLPSVKTDG